MFFVDICPLIENCHKRIPLGPAAPSAEDRARLCITSRAQPPEPASAGIRGSRRYDIAPPGSRWRCPTRNSSPTRQRHPENQNKTNQSVRFSCCHTGKK